MSFIGRRHNTKDDVKLKIYQPQIEVKKSNAVHLHSQPLCILHKMRGMATQLLSSLILIDQEWTLEYEQAKAETEDEHGETEAEKKMVLMDKAKNFVRDGILYFIDLVIE